MAKQEFVKYVDTLIESTTPQVRRLGIQVRQKYLEEIEKLVSILITHYTKLVCKSKEVTIRLKKELTIEFHIDPARLAQIQQYEDILEVAHQDRLIEVNSASYARITEHLAQTPKSKTIKAALILSLGDSSKKHLSYSSKVIFLLKKEKKVKQVVKGKKGWIDS